MESADRNEMEIEYMTPMMRDLENQEIGIEKGRDAERRDSIAEMLRDGKTPEAIADFCKYPIELIKEVQKSMLMPNRR